MADLLPKDWITGVHDLAIGFELIDSARGTRVAHPMRVVFTGAALKLPRPTVERHGSCLHVLRYQKGLTAGKRISLRFLEAPPAIAMRWNLGSSLTPEPRRFVPRLITYPILSLPPAARAIAPRFRTRRPRFFPGAAYDLPSGATGLRGKLERNSVPARWYRVTASLTLGGATIGRAHADDRGEFLLLLPAAVASAGELSSPITIQLSFLGPAAPPIPNQVNLPQLDPYWDLPEEEAPSIDVLSPNDPVSAGEAPPLGFVPVGAGTVDITLGRILSPPNAFVIP